MHGSAQQAAALLRTLLHASDFMLSTSYTPHAWGLKDEEAPPGGTDVIHPTRVGSETTQHFYCRLTRRSTPHAWGLKVQFVLGFSIDLIHPTRVGLRAAKPPRAEESAPTTWGAKILDWVVRAPHAWGNPCNAWFCAAGCGATSDFTSRFRLRTSDFVSPHAWGLKCYTISMPYQVCIHPTRVGSESIKRTHLPGVNTLPHTRGV
jgi:hypothetical protein